MTRPRIDTLSLQNFRGFGGIGHPPIALGGKNLLVYGENGAGKSSIFHALDGFFSIGEASSLARRQRLDDSKNIYSGLSLNETSVTVAYHGDGELPITWNAVRHPADVIQNSRVVQSAYRRAVLDYRSLLDVNYKFLGERINLFRAFVDVLLRDLPVPWEGSERELSRVWNRATTEFGYYHIAKRQAHIDSLLRSINDAIEALLPTLRDETNRLLRAMRWGDLEIVDFERSQLYINWDYTRPYREILGQEVRMNVRQRGEDVPSPHHLLNEARQSALALAIYLAGRTICTATTFETTPKLMVLDDVLIGLDQSNRLPVLELLKGPDFGDWQIVLLTYDRVWFEMARAHLPENGDHAWGALEIFEGVGPTGNTVPVMRPLQSFNAVDGNLARAEDFLRDNHENAAVVHTRMAFEQVLKRFCSRKGVPVAFKENAKELNTGHLLAGLDAWLTHPSRQAQKTVLDPLIADARASRSVILNAYSHSTPVTLCRAEIETAVGVVRSLSIGLSAQFPRNPPPNP